MLKLIRFICCSTVFGLAITLSVTPLAYANDNSDVAGLNAAGYRYSAVPANTLAAATADWAHELVHGQRESFIGGYRCSGAD